MNYDYTSPAWQGIATSVTIEFAEGKTYHFVVRRAYQGILESEDSAEVNYTMPTDGINVPNNPEVRKVVIININ